MIRKCKSIKEVYKEVGGFDLVLTVDAPLKTALNKLVNRPLLGQFAYTPLELASKFIPYLFDTKVLEDSELVLEVSKELNLDFKRINHFLGKIFDIWRHVDELKKVEKFLSGDEKKVLNLLKDLPTISLAMERFDFEKFCPSNKVAVIGLEFFNELDKKVLPKKYEKIEVFEKGEYKLPDLHLFYSEKDVVDRVVEMITPEIADDVAVILNFESSFHPLIKSNLVNKGVEINASVNLSEHFLVRNFIGMIDTGLNISNVTVKEIAPHADFLGIDVKPKDNNFMLSEYVKITDNKELKLFYEFLTSIGEKTYFEVISWLKKKSVEVPKELFKVLKLLALTDVKISHESFAKLSYFLENFDFEVEHKRKGVLLVNANNSVFIDRPVCFFLGLDASWTNTVTREEWISKEKEDENNLDKFQILLQQGSVRYYFVSNMRHNQLVIPCYYFNMLSGEKVESFEKSFKNIKVRNKAKKKREVFEKEKIKAESEPFEFFSQSSLNSFMVCPKKYSYDQLSSSEEQTYFLKGNLFHGFAEFYQNYKDYVKEKGDDFFVDMMLEEYKQMVGLTGLEVERSNFKIGVKNIREFIDGLKIDEKVKLKNLTDKKKDNFFADKLGKPLKSKNVEVVFLDKELSAYGKVDLVIDQKTILDYKSSASVKSPTVIVRLANPYLIKKQEQGEEDEEEEKKEVLQKKRKFEGVDLQPLFYLMELSQSTPNEKLSFLYHFCLYNNDDVINGSGDNNDNVVKVEYIPMTFNDFLTTEEAIGIIAASSQEKKKYVDAIGVQNLTKYFKDNPLPEDLQYDQDELLNHDYRKKFEEFLIKTLSGTAEDHKDKVEKLLKAVVGLRRSFRLKGDYKKAMFFKEDMEKLEVMIKQKLKEIKEYLKTSFPYKPISEDACKDCDYADICLREF